MRLLLDTHILLWTIAESRRLSADARALSETPAAKSHSASSASGRWRSKPVAAAVIFTSTSARFADNCWTTICRLAVSGAHAVALATLPPLHKDPFDRMLVAQALADGLTLVTTDGAVAKYPGPIRLV